MFTPPNTDPRKFNNFQNKGPQEAPKAPVTDPRAAFTSHPRFSVASLLNMPNVDRASLDRNGRDKRYIDDSDEEMDSFYTKKKISEDWRSPPSDYIQPSFPRSDDEIQLASGYDAGDRLAWLDQSKASSGSGGAWNSPRNMQNDTAWNILDHISLVLRSVSDVTVTRQNSAASKGKSVAFSTSTRSSPTKMQLNSIPSLVSSQSQLSSTISSFSKAHSDLPHFEVERLAELTELPLSDYSKRLEAIRDKDGFICDMDGVGGILLPGVTEFVAWLKENKKKFLFLTNNSAPTPRELSSKLKRMGVDVPEEHFYTSAIATARFLKSQKPNGVSLKCYHSDSNFETFQGSCYVVGEAGLTYALYEHGFIMNESDPEFVVIGEGNSHNFEKITKAVNFVLKGAKLIGTNPDANGPSEHGVLPATGAFVAAIEVATGKKAFYCGKPSSLMMRYAQEILETRRENTCIIGDRMDTDILAGTWAQIDPVLVMSGVTVVENLNEHAYRPYIILNGVGEIVKEYAESTKED
ncbi:hypothetical protein HK096_011432 [Nowakowskiella sp. JEL0078]|nr:hypothetical protein HK096_011432 [Nowakowskiella sp. JEL0078]